MDAEQKAYQRLLARSRMERNRALDALLRARALPDFLRCEQHRDALRFEIARREVMNEDFGVLKSELADTKKLLSEIMNANGIDEDSFSYHPFCPLCNDEGYRMGAPCKCLKEEIFRVLQEESGLDLSHAVPLESLSEGIRERAEREGYERCYRLLGDYLNRFPDVPRYLFLSGAPGSGKTYALSALALSLMRRSISVLTISAIKLNQVFLDYHLASPAEKKELLSPYLEVELLIVDDLGAENQYTNVTLPYLLLLIELRDGPMAFTTNLDPLHLRNRYGDRIFSRMFAKDNTKAITLSGIDFRIN